MVDVLAFVDDTSSREAVEQFCVQSSLNNPGIYGGGIVKAIEYLAQNTSPRFLIVDISSAQDPLRQMQSLADVCEPNITVTVIGERDEIDLYRRLIGEGVQDYLIKPVTPKQLQHSVERGLSAVSSSNVVSFFSSHGGAGATTMAMAMGSILARRSSRYTALIDFDLEDSSMAVATDKPPSDSLSKALFSPDRVDNVFVERSLESLGERLYLLCGRLEEGYTQANIATEAYAHLLGLMQDRFRYLMVDGPRWHPGYREAVATSSEAIVLLSQPTLSGLRSTSNFLDRIMEYSSEANILVVLNQVGRYRSGEIGSEQFEKALGYKISHTVRFDRNDVLNWLNKGGLILQNGGMANDIQGLLATLFPGAVEKGSNWITRLKQKLKKQ